MPSESIHRPLSSLHLPDSSPAALVSALGARGVPVCALVDLTEEPRPTPVDLESSTVGGVLDAWVALHGSYCWEGVAGGLVNLFPCHSVLDAPAAEIHAAGRPFREVLEADLGLADYGISLMEGLSMPGEPRVSVTLPAGTLRDALNGISRALNGTSWHISGRPGAYFLTFSAPEAA